MTSRLSRPLLALLLALAALATMPATSLAATPAVPSRPAATASLPWAAVAFAGVHTDNQGHVDAAVVGVVAVVVQPKNRVKGKTDPRVLSTLKTASLAALSELGKACGYDGIASGAPVYVNGDPVNLVDPDGHKSCEFDTGPCGFSYYQGHVGCDGCGFALRNLPGRQSSIVSKYGLGRYVGRYATMGDLEQAYQLVIAACARSIYVAGACGTWRSDDLKAWEKLDALTAAGLQWINDQQQTPGNGELMGAGVAVGSALLGSYSCATNLGGCASGLGHAVTHPTELAQGLCPTGSSMSIHFIVGNCIGNVGMIAAPVVPKGVSLLRRGAAVAAEDTGPLAGTTFSRKVIKQMANSNDWNHSFPTSIDDSATWDQATTVDGGSGDGQPYLHVNVPVNNPEGVPGFAQYIIDQYGEINHRFWSPQDSITQFVDR